MGSDALAVNLPVLLNLFQSTLPVWGATTARPINQPCSVFQSTLPVWGATPGVKTAKLAESIFQSTLPVWGATREFQAGNGIFLLFQSTLPVWGATARKLTTSVTMLFQSTLPVWGATGDQYLPEEPEDISIHAPRVGSDIFGQVGQYRGILFQSTLPVWGATAKADDI